MVSRIPLEHKSLVLAIFPDIELQGKEGLIEREQEFDLKPEYSGILRWEIVNYLNHLETILSAWHHNVADKKMIEEQLTYLVYLKDNHYLLESFRRAAGDAESYPCIKAFITHLTDEKAKSFTGKKKVRIIVKFSKINIIRHMRITSYTSRSTQLVFLTLFSHHQRRKRSASKYASLSQKIWYLKIKRHTSK